ncbi:zf-TFIIB domain-containing protein [Candidatus Kaiserbacteria bacterium]|nr:zf-TFIIB domain-containing protein [Candidatus Kaiserbacteria bacterium]USN92318.1 MAG: zf-TFIIB domain-containing protein [Candidatus Nomurabacteria bacterium]
MLCPKDNVVCNVRHLDDVEVDTCPKCQGVWLEQQEVRNLIRHFSFPKYSSADELLAEWKTLENSGTPPENFWIEDKLTCTKDGSQMQKHYLAGSKIGVDQCQLCKGFWLDGGELKAVASYVGPDPESDRIGRLMLRDWDLAKTGLDATKLVDVISVSLLASGKPTYALYIIGELIIRLIIDKVRK